jgi:Ni/Fe-hydrogenase subunit HybB-like protein
MEDIVKHLMPLMSQITGYIYPNEIELHWSLLIVVYPYVTGLVAGAFILASLVKVFNVRELQPVYRMALLTALAFLLVATLPLLAHLGHPTLWRFYYWKYGLITAGTWCYGLSPIKVLKSGFIN